MCLGWRSLLNEPKYGPKPLNRFVFRSAGLHTPEGADRKAYTARTFRAPSADFVKRMQNDPTSVGSKEYTRVLALSGGLPIKVGDDVVGAVGVSGSPGKDDDCFQAGIDKVAAQLK